MKYMMKLMIEGVVIMKVWELNVKGKKNKKGIEVK